MDTSNKNIESVNWQEVPNQKLEAKKQQHTKSKAGPSGSQGTKCIWCVKVGAICIVGPGMKRKVACDWCSQNKEKLVMSTCKAGKLESRVRGMMAQVVDRRMGEVVEELRGLRKGVAAMAKSNWDLTWVLYHRFQSVDTLVDEVQIFGAKGFLPKLAPESKPAKDKLQETLREVEELQEEHLEWAMECLQMRKEWMWQEEAALTKCL
ncbi:hypothetical protein ID866_11866, partial [Astraeus odoratus]